MPSSHVTIKIVIGFLALLLTGVHAAAAELSTLFTTPQERELIDSNRYGSGDDKPKVVVDVDKTIETPVQQIFQEAITRQYKISGITISRDGPHTVWINSAAYEDGGELEDKSKIKVMVGDEIRVRITAPDGKNYYATSGETLEVSYLAAVGG
jgi:hypothetical protein